MENPAAALLGGRSLRKPSLSEFKTGYLQHTPTLTSQKSPSGTIAAPPPIKAEMARPLLLWLRSDANLRGAQRCRTSGVTVSCRAHHDAIPDRREWQTSFVSD